MIDKESLIVSMHELGPIKFVETMSDSGRSPIQVDLQHLASRPATLRRVARIMQTMATSLNFDRVCAIPMGGLTIGIALSLTIDKPLIYPRLQGRESSVSRFIAGQYTTGETMLLIDDELSHAGDQLTAITLLQTVRLKVTDVMFVLDRDMGGREAIEAKGVRVHTILTIPEVLDTLLKVRRITPDQHQSIIAWFDSDAPRRRKAAVNL